MLLLLLLLVIIIGTLGLSGLLNHATLPWLADNEDNAMRYAITE